MKKVLTNIIVVFLTLNVLIALSGINIYEHYCGCSDAVTSSLLVDNTCCDHENDHHDCGISDNHLHQCCDNGNNPKSNEDQSNKKNNCCQTVVKIFKLDKPFTFNASNYLPQPTLISQMIFENFNEEAPEVFTEANFTRKIPPPLYGKDLVRYIHQLKLDTPLIMLVS